MKITARNLLRHELIGLKVRVKDSTDPGLKGLKGEVVDETMKTLTIRKGERKLMLPKSNTRFAFSINGREVTVEGKVLAGRPEERLKVKKRIWL
ncbi:MAG: ribonuclease P protein component 1 [Candidatus Bathyarchaeia archaeon]